MQKTKEKEIIFSEKPSVAFYIALFLTSLFFVSITLVLSNDLAITSFFKFLSIILLITTLLSIHQIITPTIKIKDNALIIRRSIAISDKIRLSDIERIIDLGDEGLYIEMPEIEYYIEQTKEQDSILNKISP